MAFAPEYRKFLDVDGAKANATADRPTSAEGVDTNGRSVRITEEQFYQSFADWLKDDQGEVVESLALGGASFKSKWGTPDVIGVYKPRKSDFVEFPIEIVTAEIKVDSFQSVIAFGQACAYRLFSHKTYIAMPQTMGREDRDRLEVLCSLYGVGLVFFEPNPDEPAYKMAIKAQRFQPDMFYANEFARRLQEISRESFDRLF